MAATTSFSKDTRLLHFAAKLLQRDIKGDSGVDDNLAHHAYQRDRPLSR